MNRPPSKLADVLAECDTQGIRLLLDGDGGLTIDAPQETLTPELLDRLKAHKADILALLRPSPDLAPASALPGAVQSIPMEPVCRRCGSTIWRDVPIHGGQSVRRDCGQCGRFVEFPIWHGKNTGQNDQHSV